MTDSVPRGRLAVDVTRDRLDRLVVLIDEPTFALLRAAHDAGWVEVADMNVGYSTWTEPGSEASTVLAAVLDAVARSDQADDTDRERARGGHCYGSLTTLDRWDPDTRWWREGVWRSGHSGGTVGGAFYRFGERFRFSG